MARRSARAGRGEAMNARGAIVLLALGALLLLLSSSSCNAILDNDEGRLVAKDAGLGEARCGPGQKQCGGACVDILNPAFGCKENDCTACELASTLEYKCAGLGTGLECGVSSCFDRYFNCDLKNPTGCEVDLRKPKNCGRCGETCVDSDYCDSYSANIHCVPTCPEGSTVCKDEHQCINPQTDIANCGGCGKTCPAPPGTIPTCEVGACGFRCDTARGFRECGGKCVQESVDACGESCTKCPAPDANHTVACESGKCVEKCKHPLCNGQCIPPAECKSTCGQNPVDCGSGKCDTDICSAAACGGCNKPCSTAAPNSVASCAPPDATDPNCHCVIKCAPPAQQCPITGCSLLTQNPNCGTCGRDCGSMHASCVPNGNGAGCGAPCAPNWNDCNGSMADGCEIPSSQFVANGANPHCGGCNMGCSNCINGTCQPGDGGTDGGPADSGIDGPITDGGQQVEDAAVP